MSRQRTGPTPKRAALFVVILLDALVAFFILQQISAYRDYPFDSDEARHATSALELALDLRAGDFGAFFAHSYQHTWYPPAFYWLEAFALSIFGPSALVARVVGLVCLFAAALVIYAIGLELDEKWGWLAGLVAAALTLASQPILVHSALVMLEIPGLLVSALTLWGYLRAVRHPAAWRFALVSILMALTMLTKYPYGIVVVASIAAVEVPAALLSLVREGVVARPWGSMARRWLWLFGPFLLVMLIWFAGPYKIAGLVDYAGAAAQEELLSEENLIFYPRSMVYHYAPSPVFAPLMLAGLIWAAARWRDRRVRLLLIYFLIGLLVMTVKLLNQPRYFVTIAPASHLLTGAMLAWLVAQWSEIRPRVRIVAAASVLALVVGSVPMLIERFAVFPALMRVEYETDPRANDLAAWITAQVPSGERFYLVNPWDQFGAAMMTWYLATQNTPPVARFADAVVPSANLGGSAWKRGDTLLANIRAAGTRYVVALEGGANIEPLWPEYEFALSDRLLPVTRGEFVMDFYDMTRWLKRHVVTRDELERAESARYHQLNVRASVYRLVEP